MKTSNTQKKSPVLARAPHDFPSAAAVAVEFGQWLRTQIDWQHLTQGQAARQCGISRVHLARILSGDTGVSRDTLLAIAEGLGIDPHETLLRAGFSAGSPIAEELPSELALYKQLPPEAQEIVRRHIKALYDIYSERPK